jgi:hypothetical protein
LLIFGSLQGKVEAPVSSEADKVPAAIGMRVKSGWGTRGADIPVCLKFRQTGMSAPPVDRRVIDLSDPAVPESRQPYHAGMGRHETDEAKINQRRKVVIQAANRSVTELIWDYGKVGHRITAVALMVGSDTDPTRITNPHIRAHALEGRLFRTVLEDAVRSCGLPCSAIIERNIYTQAANILKRRERDLKRRVAEFGRRLEGPWRADEKTACLAAWLALA